MLKTYICGNSVQYSEMYFKHCREPLKHNESASAFTGTQRKCPSHLYQCGSGECVDPRLVCNGFTNCADSSDEGVGCTQRNCSSPSAPQCDHHCVSTPNGPVSTVRMCMWLHCFVPNLTSVCCRGMASKLLLAQIHVYLWIFHQPVAARELYLDVHQAHPCLAFYLFSSFLQRCYCAAGFKLHTSAVSCVDFDECNAVPHAVCKHTCLNTRGSYTCHCHPGFYLEPDNKSCKTKGTVGLHTASACWSKYQVAPCTSCECSAF